MPSIFPIRHGGTKRLGVLTCVQGQRTSLDYPRNTLTNSISGRLTVITANAGTVGAGEIYEGVLALIKKLSIEVNGSETRYRTSGKQILIDTITQSGKSISSLGAINFAAVPVVPYIVDFTIRFDLPGVFQMRDFGLDFRKEKGKPDAFNAIKLHVDWGLIGDIAQDTGGITMTSATLELEAEVEVNNIGSIDPRTGRVINVRKLMVERRSVHEIFAATNDAYEIKVPRVDGTVLKSITVLSTMDGAPKIFNRGGRITLNHDDYEIINRGVWAMKINESQPRQAEISDEMIHVNIIKDLDLLTGIPNALLDQEMKLTVPVLHDGSGSKHVLDIYYTYAKPVAPY